MKSMSLTEFIREKGDAAVAEMVGVTARTAADWRRQQRKPHPKYIPALLAAGRGSLTLESLYRVESANESVGCRCDVR